MTNFTIKTKKMEKLTDEQFEIALQNYIGAEINWEAYNNEVIKAANKSDVGRGDVEQFAADSFFSGVVYVMQKYGIQWG
jgi:hypothetical protein